MDPSLLDLFYWRQPHIATEGCIELGDHSHIGNELGPRGHGSQRTFGLIRPELILGWEGGVGLDPQRDLFVH